MNFLQWIFCKHPRIFFVRNIYGDEINVSGGNRSLWHCPDCKMYEYRRDLGKDYTLDDLLNAPGNVLNDKRGL